jgi:hypothetical protein
MIQCGMEQLVARRAHNPKVVSSSLAPATRVMLYVIRCYVISFREDVLRNNVLRSTQNGPFV